MSTGFTRDQPAMFRPAAATDGRLLALGRTRAGVGLRRPVAQSCLMPAWEEHGTPAILGTRGRSRLCPDIPAAASHQRCCIVGRSLRK
jgi:hypothetical protein